MPKRRRPCVAVSFVCTRRVTNIFIKHHHQKKYVRVDLDVILFHVSSVRSRQMQIVGCGRSLSVQ